jgi:hypothetical protein
MISFFLSSLYCFAATCLTGVWTVKKIDIVVKIAKPTGYERTIYIDLEYITITNYEKTESTKAMYSFNEDKMAIKLNDGKTIKMINDNMILLYDDNKFTPSLFIRDGHDISFLEKPVRGSWIYKQKNQQIVYQFRLHRLVVDRTDNRHGEVTWKVKWVAPYEAHFRDHPNVYSTMAIGYEARLLSDDFAVMYTTYPPGHARSITVLVKIR